MAIANHKKDLKLAREVTAGSIPAWHRFVEQYSALIYSVEHRYLYGESDELRRTVFVDTLESLYAQKLEAYDGSSALSTWVSLIARRLCLDHLRRQLGRRDPPSWLALLGEQEQSVYQLYYLEGLDYAEICRRLGEPGKPISVRELTCSFDKLERRMTLGLRRRMAYDLHARSSGERLGRLAEYLDALRDECRDKSARTSPMHLMEEKTQGMRIARIQEALEKLPESDREMLHMYFFQERTARDIARDRGLANPRRAYTLIDRSLRRLRLLFEASSPDVDLASKPVDTRT